MSAQLRICVLCGRTVATGFAGWWWVIEFPHGNAGVCSACADGFLAMQFSLATNKKPARGQRATKKGTRR